jgi:hypothetical protein
MTLQALAAKEGLVIAWKTRTAKAKFLWPAYVAIHYTIMKKLLSRKYRGKKWYLKCEKYAKHYYNLRILL